MQRYFRFIIIIFVFTLPAAIIFAQKSDLENPFSLKSRYTKQNNYITPIFELKANEEKYLASPLWKTVYLEAMIDLYNCVGDYEEAYRLENIFYENSPAFKRMREQYKGEITELKNSPVAGYKMLDALEAVDRIAGKRQVIMVNEEHRTPFHRVFTFQLLSRLYAKGFRYFATETLNSSDVTGSTEDAELNKRGFPVQSTGTYTADPIYADVIRTALRLGYKVVPYESIDATCKPPADNPEFCNDRRERGQARNLYERILKNDPQAKILVHVGRAHNYKGEAAKEFNFMGYYFKELSKIEPFTIDQLRFSERRDTAYEQPLYRFLTKNNILREPSVFESTDGKFYAQSEGYDMFVFHPRMSYENGRAVFLKTRLSRKSEKINPGKLNLKSGGGLFNESEPVLIQAFYSRESEDAVPVDQIILYPNQKIPFLMLPKGSFRVRAMNRSGKVLAQYDKKKS